MGLSRRRAKTGVPGRGRCMFKGPGADSLVNFRKQRQESVG